MTSKYQANIIIVPFAILVKIVQLSSRNPCYMLIIWGKGQALMWAF